MNTLARSGRWWRVAAVVSALVAVLAIVGYDVPTLIDGADASADPYWIVLGSFASDVVALVAAYWAWRRQWSGVVLLIVVNVFWLVQSITTIIDPKDDFDVVFSVVMTAAHVFALWCCLAQRDAGARAAARPSV